MKTKNCNSKSRFAISIVSSLNQATNGVRHFLMQYMKRKWISDCVMKWCILIPARFFASCHLLWDTVVAVLLYQELRFRNRESDWILTSTVTSAVAATLDLLLLLMFQEPSFDWMARLFSIAMYESGSVCWSNNISIAN